MSSFYNQIKLNENQYELKINLEKVNYFPGEVMNVKIQIISKTNIKLNFNSLRICYFMKNIEYWQNNMNIRESNNQTPNGNNLNEKKDILKDKKNYYENIILSKEEEINNLNNLSNNYPNNKLNTSLKIQLPKDIKPSFEWYKDDNIYCFSRTILSISIPDLELNSYNHLFIKRAMPDSLSNINFQKILGNESFLLF